MMWRGGRSSLWAGEEAKPRLVSSILTRKAEALSTQSVGHGARINTDFGAELMAQSGAVGGCSGEVAEVCQAAAGTALPCQSCSKRGLCRSPSVTASERCGRSGQSFLLVNRSCSLHLGTAGNLINWLPIYFS